MTQHLLDPLERLCNRSTFDGVDGCWLWQGAVNRDGHAKITVEKKSYQIHRYAYMRLVDEDLTSEVILRHRCDMPACWNPRHMQPGTHADNVRDKVERGRHLYGEKIGTAKLTTEKARAIKDRHASGESAASLSREFGVSYKTVRLILKGESWKHA